MSRLRSAVPVRFRSRPRLLPALLLICLILACVEPARTDTSPAVRLGDQASITWTGSGHFVLEPIGYVPTPYTVQPNFRQASTSLGAASSTISSADSADTFVNFDYDTSGKSVYLVYTTNGSAPTKSNGTVVNAGFSSYIEPNRTWRASIPVQPLGTTVNYVYYISDSSLANGFGRISGTVASRNTSQYQLSWSESDNAYFTYTVIGTSPSPITLTDTRALWLDTNTIAWNNAAASSYRLLYDADGGVTSAAESTVCTFPTPSGPCYVALTASGTISGYPKNPNATGLTRLTTGLSAENARHLLQGQVAVAGYNSGGSRVSATRVQIQSVLDALYAAAAKPQTLGVSYSGAVPTLRVWAPTAKSVAVQRFADATTPTFTTHALTRDSASGVWSVTGDASWDRHYYLLDVEVYVPSLDQVVHNVVTDPYAVTLSADSTALTDPRSQFVNLADADLKPAGWDVLSKPALAAPEDITVYEVHVRDFSISDPTVAQVDRGTFRAFTYDGAGPAPNATLSAGMDHLLKLRQAGLSHVHLLPVFDIASVPEDAVPRDVSPNPTGFGRSAQDQQNAVAAARATDGFNWGYDPFHYGAPEGSYSTNPAVGTQRILEFREMVQALNQNGLRVVMDVVYNHTAAGGQDDHSVLDKVVPGYYYRYDATGVPYTSSCCSDTASEYEMMEDLLIDTLLRWAVDYKVDGFRFDLMNLHTKQNAVNARDAVQAVDPDIYVYGEGWDFGSAAAKGLTTCPDCYAKQVNMAGTGIGTFNDRLRDAAHGGYTTDSTQIRAQGFINGLSYDWNGYCYNNRFQADLDARMDILRSALRASGTDWNGQGSPYTDDPQESVPYVSKHDNETLFDQNVFKLPSGDGSGLPGWCGSSIPFTTTADRVRVQNMGLSLVGLAQGVPFFHMGSDTLRSKSLDRNSYDSGDWFNRVDWSYATNNFGVGLPPAWDNSSRWTIMTPLLNNSAVDPTPTQIQDSAEHLREVLRLRMSSPLFRLTTEADVNSRVRFHNGSNAQSALLVMELSDEPAPDLDPAYESILIFFNAHKVAQNVTISGANGFTLHPHQADAVDADPVVQGAAFNDAGDTFTIPARTTAVFVSTQAVVAPSTIDWVGKMYPRGGVANAVDEGNFAPSGFDVYVRVYEAGVTETAGAPTGISCTLHWGAYGTTWIDLPMTYSAQIGNDDEFKATIPQATLNALAPGNYGYTAYCKKASEAGLKWKVDQYDIDGNPLDDDQGDGLITVIPSADSRPNPPGAVMVHLFEWRWADIEKECTYLAAKGYSGVQVSPPNEHLVPTADQGGQPASDFPWWARYQPVSHDAALLTSRSGSLTEFQNMVTTCNSLGVDIIVDAVFNHMADIEVGAPPAGTAGTQYESGAIGRFYGSQYQSDDFNPDCAITSYQDRAQVQRCELSGLPDLNTGKADVQSEIRSYLQALIDMGVAGFRFDGAKHMPAQDIAAVVDGLTGDFYVFQEVIDIDTTERVRDWEYTPVGDITEFAYSQAMADKFNQCNGSIGDLATLPYANMVAGRFAVVFVDNHDNQRGHGPGGTCIVDHRDGAVYDLANIFMLAHSYGNPKVMSSYYWQSNPADNSGDSLGPPSTTPPHGAGTGAETRPVYGAGQSAGDVPANCSAVYEDGKWVCEHRRTAIANMVQFRAVTAGQPVTNWQTFAANDIAFGRNDRGYVAVNRTAGSVTHTYTTAMPPGTYCDIVHYDFLPATGQCVLPGTTTDAPVGDLVTVDNGGQIFNRTVNALDAFAVHSGARLSTDYSSGPSSYGLAWHYDSGLRLGASWRADDGVTHSADWVAGSNGGNVDVNASVAGYLWGWVDLNCDGDYADTVSGVAEAVIAAHAVSAGSQNVPFDLPADFFDTAAPCANQTVHARFRLAAALPVLSVAEPTGAADSGEVEDYGWEFATLPVTLAYFYARAVDGGVEVVWTTATEMGNIGFNLWAASAESPALLTDRMVLSPVRDSTAPQHYRLRLDGVPGGTFYLEDVDFRGRVTRHGPFALNTPYGAPLTPQAIDWAAIAAGSAALAAARVPAAPAAPVPLTPLLAAPVATGYARGIQLHVSADGLYRVTYADLLAAGFDPLGAPMNRLSLTQRDQPVPLRVSNGGAFGTASFVEFWGSAETTLYTDTAVYTLWAYPDKVARIADDWTPVPTGAPTTFQWADVTVADANAYSYLAPNGDPWYHAVVMAYGSAATLSVPFTVSGYLPGVAPATLTVDLWGLTDWPVDPDHHVQVSLNGTLLADALFDGLVAHPLTLTVPDGVLLEGGNTLTLHLPYDLPGVGWDMVIFDGLRLTYPQALTAPTGALTFVASGTAIKVDDLPRAAGGTLYRISDDGSVTRVRRFRTTLLPENRMALTFAGTPQPATYVLQTGTAAAWQTPAVVPALTVNDITTGSADYLIISHADFIDGLAPLVAFHESRGLTVKIVDVADVYHQFSGGAFDAAALRAYLGAVAPGMGVQYVLLVGGDTYDYRDHLGLGSMSFIPSLYAPTEPYVSFAPVDPLLVDFDADGVPDLPIGRFPVRTPAELANVIDKTLAYAAKDYGHSAVLTADDDGGGRFSGISRTFAAQLGSAWSVVEAFLDDAGVTAARATLLAQLNAGTALTQFLGHSGPVSWTYDGLLQSADIAALSNTDRPTVVLQWGCWNTYHVEPTYNTLAHAFMLNDGGGAAAVLGATTLTLTSSDEALGRRVTPLAVQPGVALGAAVQAAKDDLALTRPDLGDVLLGWTLLGDPALVIAP